jgi:hypothetical protein
MLTRVLLYMIATASSIDAAMHLRSCGECRGSKVQDASIFLVRNFCDGDLLVIRFQHAKIVDLASASGIKRGAIEHDGRLSVALKRFNNARVEVVEK